MKKLLLITALLSLSLVGVASAEIGWAGNIWPNSGADVAPTGDLNVYVQVWKDGVTNPEGQGADIEASLVYFSGIPSLETVVMTYHGDVGANDEYVGVIPQSALMAGDIVSIEIVITDLSDGVQTPASGDQAGNPLPLIYNVVDVTPVDIDVTFQLCMSGEAHAGAPFVVGSHPVIGEWCQNGNLPVQMTQVSGDLYEAVVTFPAGSNPSFEYKYQKSSCADWEPGGNRSVTLPTDNSTVYAVPQVDSWNNLPLGCGLGNVLDADKEICLQVCLDGVDNTGGVCIVGNVAELDNWGAGIPATMVGPGLYQVCIVYPAGTPQPINLEYKAKKDDCNTWENGDNQTFVVDNSLAPETTLTHTWEGGAGQCAPVANEDATFSGLKAQFR